MDHLFEPLTRLWADLGAPDPTPALKREIVLETLREAGDRPRAALERARDNRLVALLNLLSAGEGRDGRG